MIRFEIPAAKLSPLKAFLQMFALVAGIFLLAFALLFDSENKALRFSNGAIGLSIVLKYLPIKRGKQLRFVEIDDQQIKWNNYEAENNKDISSTPVILNWSAIKWIKLLHNNKLVFFEASSFDSQLWLHHYPADQQQIIIDTVKAYGERFSLRWVAEQKEAAIA